MRFERDLFISYAHIDNEPIPPADVGWITQFDLALRTALRHRIGRPVDVWRDERGLAGNHIFAREITDQLPKTAAFVAVLSPRYVSSDWCLKEVQEFCAAAERAAGLLVGNQARVLKVIKLPPDTEAPLPPAMQGALGFQFFAVGDRNTPLEFDPGYGPEMAMKFRVAVAQLAEQIKQLLKELDEATGAGRAADVVPASAAAPSRPVVYLADCAYDQRDAHQALRTELRMRGYSVLPDRDLPNDEEAYVAEVTRLLARSALAVHLVGSEVGAVPNGPRQRSVTMLQNDLAAERSRAHGLTRVVWLPRDVTPNDPRQRAFVDALRQDAAAQYGADVIAGDVEALKTAVGNALRRLEAPPPSPKPARVDDAETEDADSRLVYLICDARDIESRATHPLRKALTARGVDVEVPLFEGDAATIRASHAARLAEADAVLVFYGAGDAVWKSAIDAELRKARAARRGRRLPEPVTIVVAPSSAAKADLVDLDAAIDARDALSDAAVDAFVGRLRGA